MSFSMRTLALALLMLATPVASAQTTGSSSSNTQNAAASSVDSTSAASAALDDLSGSTAGNNPDQRGNPFPWGIFGLLGLAGLLGLSRRSPMIEGDPKQRL